MADTLTTEQTLTYPFQVLDGRDRPAAIDGTPTVQDSDPSVASSAVTPGSGVGNWNLVVTGIAPTIGDAVAQTTVTIDADLTPEGTDNKVGSVQYTVTLDPRTGAKSITFGAPVAEDKPV